MDPGRPPRPLPAGSPGSTSEEGFVELARSPSDTPSVHSGPLSAVAFRHGDCAPAPRGHLATSGNILGCHNSEMEGLLNVP